MTTIERINQLLDQGEYLEAAKLADKHKITDCRNVCEYLDDIKNIGNSIDGSISVVTSMEEKIKKYESKLRGVKDIAFQMEEKEGAFQIRRKNFSAVCDLIDDLVKNLRISENVQRTLLEGNLNDETFIEKVSAALEEFQIVLQYKPDPILQHSRCVMDQKAHAENIKAKFGTRFYEQFSRLVDILLSEYQDNFINVTDTSITMPGYDAIHSKLLYLAPVVNWIQKNDERTYQSLLDLFSLLGDQLIAFANFYNTQDGLYSLYLLVKLSQHVLSDNNSHSFLSQIYGKVLARVKRNFDNFMEQQIQTIRDLKAPKQSKCGVLSVVKNFEQFTRQVESLLRSTGARRADIDRWYVELVKELFRTIDSIEHSRTPTEMIRVENYKYLNDFLRSNKVPCLEAHQVQARQECEAAVEAYAKRYSSKPLEKLNTFFEGVEAKVAQGVKEEEISFQLAFSRQELRKVLQMVTLKEVQKGLEEMYRRIEKHASEPDSSLMEVVWRAMQQEFVSQYEYIQGMIERCYPATNLSLTFTIDDVLRVFSDIAQSH